MPASVAGMPGTNRYVIRTAAGDKGPFSRDQIAAFVEAGKLPSTAKIMDMEAKRPVTAAEAIGVDMVADPEADDDFPMSRADQDADTPEAPGVRAVPRTERSSRNGRGTPPSRSSRRASRTDTGGERGARGERGTQRGRRPRKRGYGIWIVLGVAVIAAIAIGVFALSTMKEDKFKEQPAALLANALAHPESLAPGSADAPFVRILAKRFHQQALDAAHLTRGTYEGSKPAYDESRYLETLRAAVTKQIAEADSGLLTSCARELAMPDDAASSDISTAKKLAQQAVTMDGEKNHHSLDALAWATFRGGDAKRACLIEEQAMELAPDTASKTECGKALVKFKSKLAATGAAAAE